MTDQAGARKPSNFPWIRNVEEDLVNSYGGLVVELEAVIALNIGDQIFIDGDGLADKSATEADYALAFGFVVGGDLIDMYEVAPYALGVPAAAIGGQVYVCYAGKAPGIAADDIVAGDPLSADASTAGRVSATGATAGKSSMALSGGAAGEAIIVLLPYILA